MGTPDGSASGTTLPAAGSARTAADVRSAFESTLARAAKAVVSHASGNPVAGDLGGAVAAALRKEEATAEDVATDYRLELVDGSARRLWLRVKKTGEWVHLDNPTDAVQERVQAAFCNRALKVAVRYRGEVIADLEVQATKAPSLSATNRRREQIQTDGTD